MTFWACAYAAAAAANAFYVVYSACRAFGADLPALNDGVIAVGFICATLFCVGALREETKK